MYGKQVHHVLARHSSSNPSLPDPNSIGGGGGAVQGDCRKACALQASRLSLPRGEVRELQGDVEIHHDLARDPSSCPMPSIPKSAGGIVVEELGGEVVESMSPESFPKQAMVSHLKKSSLSSSVRRWA